jgi:hypothetical protein
MCCPNLSVLNIGLRTPDEVGIIDPSTAKSETILGALRRKHKWGKLGMGAREYTVGRSRRDTAQHGSPRHDPSSPATPRLYPGTQVVVRMLS